MLHICTAQARWWIIIPDSRVWILSKSKKLFFLSDIPHSSDTDADPTYSTKAPTVEYPSVAPEGAVENVSMVHVFVIIVVFFLLFCQANSSTLCLLNTEHHLSDRADLRSQVDQPQTASLSLHGQRVMVSRRLIRPPPRNGFHTERNCLSFHVPQCQKMRQWWKFPIPLRDRHDNWLSVTFSLLQKQVVFLRVVVFIKCCVTSAEEESENVMCGRQCDWMDYK